MFFFYFIFFNNFISRFFKKSDRDRHMRSKHDTDVLSCSKCQLKFSNKELFLSHEKKCGVGTEQGSKSGVVNVNAKAALHASSNCDNGVGRSDSCWSDKTDGMSSIPSPASSLNI